MSKREEMETAVRRFIDLADNQDDARVGLYLTGLVNDHFDLIKQVSELRQKNDSLKRKMAYLERRARARMHGLVDLFTTDREEGEA